MANPLEDFIRSLQLPAAKIEELTITLERSKEVSAYLEGGDTDRDATAANRVKLSAAFLVLKTVLGSSFFSSEDLGQVGKPW
jgi:hypothetical protein